MVELDHEERVDWRYLRRRFLSGRSIAWAVIVLVVALGLNYWFPDPASEVEPVVSTPEASVSPVEPPSMSAVEP